MASTTTSGPLWLAALLGCRDGDEDKLPSDEPSDTTHADDTTPAPTGDTGTAPTDVWPLCDHIGRTETVTLLGADRLDYLGHSVDVADIDGDECAEVAIAATWSFGYYQPGEGAVYLITSDGLASGDIDDLADATWQEPGASFAWVYRVALVPPQVVWLTSYREETEGTYETLKIFAFDLPDAPLEGTVGRLERAGDVYNPGYPHAASDIEGCLGLATPSICAGSASSGPEFDFAGAIWLYDAPLQGSLSLLDFRTRISGNVGERAETIEADDDLDGDGLDDLVIGAYYAAGTGRVGIVSAPPDGDHLLWEIAYAILDGVVDGAEAGLGLATGDLDSDGYVDVFVGAPIEDSGYAYVAMGPFSGVHSLADAAYTVTSDIGGQWTGYDGAIGDMTGDGQAELIVGAPHSIYFNSEPGTVAVFQSPAPGDYTVSNADITLTSGSPGPDAFGLSIAPGDIDGDGLLDLAIGAPDDNRNGGLAGSVTIVFGASL